MTEIAMNLDEQVREALRGKIIAGELAGGFHLSELKISKEYNVSRTPVREALCALAADGLIEMVPHRGAFVTEIPVDIRADQIHTYTLFMALIARQTSENGNIELLLDLETASQSLSDAAEQDNGVFLEALSNVNAMLRQAANSPTLHDALTMVERRTDTNRVWEQAITRKKEVAEHYTKLVKAIKQHETNEAEVVMRAIMELVAEPILSTLKA
ncbi:MAG: GntR family transcriptional regulator [Alphaproteobacteria bacterium]|nr:GntR family transcriptional regulator [Alphaproteobacteria bacterium]MDD9919177.1 GntR family transcriptional regulator [Alphaproteobacteria bacterium]